MKAISCFIQASCWRWLYFISQLLLFAISYRSSIKGNLLIITAYIHELSIFRIAALFLCMLVHSKYSPLSFPPQKIIFFVLLQKLNILENIWFPVFCSVFDQKIISLSLQQIWICYFCWQRSKCFVFSIVREIAYFQLK